MRVTLTALTPQGPQDVLVSGDDDATVGDVAAALGPVVRQQGAPAERLAPVISIARNGPGDPGSKHGLGDPSSQRAEYGQPLWLNGGQADPWAPAARMLRDGAVVALDHRAAGATARAEPTGVVEVRFVGGPAAGVVHRLGYGTVTIGASPDSHIRLAGVGLPAYAARLTVGPSGTGVPVVVEPLHTGPDATPLLVDGERATGQRNLSFGMIIKIGANVLEVRQPQPPDAHLSAADDGGLAYNRPPRIAPPARAPRIEVPGEPARGERVRLQLLAAMVPVLLGVVMVKVTHQWTYALFVLASPLMLIGQWASDRRHGRSSYKKAMKEYRQRWAELDGVIAAARVTEEAQRRHDAPDPAEVLLTATGPRRRLWERRASDDDVLRLRFGLADQASRIEMALDKKAQYGLEPPSVPPDRDVPVTLSLKDLGVVGIAGDAAASRGLARWLVAQAAVLHSPRDLSIVILSDDPHAAEHWNWVRWLPHCVPGRGAPGQGADCVALVGADPQTVTHRVAELAGQAAERMRNLSSPGHSGTPSQAEPRTLVVLDGARTLRRVPGMPQVLATARMSGISAICIDDTERELPEECAAVVSWDPYTPGYVTLRGGTDVPGLVLADQVGAGWADRAARALAPIRDISREDGQAAIPSAARLLDLLGMPDPSVSSVLGLWERYGRTTAVPIGIGADGPFVVDIRADGPHALIAGTTGAGKSELLQTLIASLAAANRPDAMNFVLIDYKGGSAFKDCARLPHTVGMVSDLDGHLTERALASLAAELKRREEILLAAGAKDIEDYWEATSRARGRFSPAPASAAEPLPRLMLVIDEFASLVAELPDFVAGLVGIAQRGRSLGVHLVLATQRPAGVVSADIRANTNLRIALRVTDAAESLDVIDVPDAARIARSTPGRCYVRSGASAPAAVQSARIGGRRPGTGRAQPAAALAVPVPWPALGSPRRRGHPALPPPRATTTWKPTCRRSSTRSRARRSGSASRSSAARGSRRCRRPSRSTRSLAPPARPGLRGGSRRGAAGRVRHHRHPGQAGAGAADPGPRARRAPRGGGNGQVGQVHGAADARRLGRGDRLAWGRAHLRARLRFRLAAPADPAAALRERGVPRPDRPGRTAARDAARRDHQAPAGARRLRVRRGRRAARAHARPGAAAALDAAALRLVGGVRGGVRAVRLRQADRRDAADPAGRAGRRPARGRHHRQGRADRPGRHRVPAADGAQPGGQGRRQLRRAQRARDARAPAAWPAGVPRRRPNSGGTAS